nr:reverse transcriptase domain-containing protein [Tanacetum cinerariifolium]
MVRALLLDKKNQSSVPAPSCTPAQVKAVEPNCVTCGGANSYQNCPATNENIYRDNIQEYVSQAAAANYNQGNTVVAPVSALMPNLKASIPYPSRRDNERRCDQANEQIEKFYEIFKDMSFEISFTDALILMPKFASTLKALIGNKEKLSEMARTSMSEHCSVVILNKLPRKLGDPGKFLNPCEFPGMDECLALADLGASINLMPLFIWEVLLLSELTPTCMTLELVDCLVSKPIGIAKDVSVKVGVFHFPANFVVVDFKLDPRVPLILRRKKAITYNLDQTMRYSVNYNQMTANKIDVIDLACEEYSQEVLGFSDVTVSGNPTPHDDPIISTTSPTLTLFGDSDFLLFEEADAFLGLEDDLNSSKINLFYYDPEGNILLLEAILNSEPLPLLPNHEQYLPSFKKELKACEAKTVKSSVDEPPEIELKDLPHHLEYAFLEGDNKFPVIIAKELGDEEKSALIKVLKSHKRAIAWKLSDIQGINPEFCTHKILREEDYKLMVQHQRRVNLKIYDVIKKEVEKLLDAGLIYPISDSPRVSPVHCVPKKGGFIVVENKENELIPTRLVTRWRRTNSIVSSIVSSGIFKFPLTLVIRRKQRSPVFMARLPIDACLLVCAMHQARFKGGIVLGHNISKNRIEVDKAKVNVIAKLPHPTTVEDCIKASQMLKNKLTKVPILIAPNWDLPFELICDTSDFSIGAVLGLRHEKHFKPIHYASKMMTDAESNYTMTEKEMLTVVYAFKKFRSYLIMNKSIVNTDYFSLKYLFAKKDAKARLLRWVLLLQEFDFKVLDTKGAENLAADHLSRLENPYENVLDPKEINETFPLETLSMVTFRGDSSAPWFADFANYHAGNFIVKAKALPTNEARVVCKFLRSLFARFGAPRAIISDRGTHFSNDLFEKVMLKYGVTHHLSIANHPQTSGKVEVSNRGLKRILERTIGKNHASWSDKLDDALWAFRTAYKTSIECTPYKLVYGKACHLPIELEHKAYWALKQVNFDLAVTGDHRKVQFNELNELRDHDYDNSLIYKEKTKRIHDSKIKNCVFNVSDQVLLFNSRLKIFSGKLKIRWSGPFTITKVFSYGTVELSQANGPNFKVNGHRVKHYFRGDVPQLVVPNLQTFLMDNEYGELGQAQRP